MLKNSAIINTVKQTSGPISEFPLDFQFIILITYDCPLEFLISDPTVVIRLLFELKRQIYFVAVNCEWPKAESNLLLLLLLGLTIS